MSTVEISVDQMYQIENKGHDMGFLKKFMMENAGAVAVRKLIEKIGDVNSKNIIIFVGMGVIVWNGNFLYPLIVELFYCLMRSTY